MGIFEFNCDNFLYGENRRFLLVEKISKEILDNKHENILKKIKKVVEEEVKKTFCCLNVVQNVSLLNNGMATVNIIIFPKNTRYELSLEMTILPTEINENNN